MSEIYSDKRKSRMFDSFIEEKIEDAVQKILVTIREKIKECEEKACTPESPHGFIVDRIDVGALKELHNDLCKQHGISTLIDKVRVY